MHVPVRVECAHTFLKAGVGITPLSVLTEATVNEQHIQEVDVGLKMEFPLAVCRRSNYLGNLELSKNLCLMQTNKSFIEFRTKKWMNTAWGGASPSAGWCLLNVSVGGWVVMLWSPLPFPCNLPRCDAPLCLTPRWPPSRPASLLSWALPGPQLLTRVKEKKKKYIYIYMPLYVLLYKSIKKEYREI